ncbi:hypothetical protein RND71_007970 [Anisodus tanguticus]|uniref:PPM-type phosphatase domain-containing protein n=1 Tax=Anisodus tanguticus TaxID=243964 RepID=A0AAE1SMW6_9SOLA|nr:hypothetical protein RND71_007970 [Anisodus tanguticus]
MMHAQTITDPREEIKISFGYNNFTDDSGEDGIDNCHGIKLQRANNSFSCLSGAALSANATLANTNICNDLLGAEILPALDSPTSFRRILSSKSFSRLKLQAEQLVKTEFRLFVRKRMDHFSVAYMMDSMEEMLLTFWLVLYEIIGNHLNLLDWEMEQESGKGFCGTLHDVVQDDRSSIKVKDTSCDSFKQKVLKSLEQPLFQAESDFLHMVEQEMDDRPDLVSIGCCVLVVLLHGKNMYVLNLGDSRAVLATHSDGITTCNDEVLQAEQLTISHNVDDESERTLLLKEHPDDPSTIVGGKVKGRLKVTWALGVGYLKKLSSLCQTIPGDSSPGPSALLPVNRGMCLNNQGLRTEQLISPTKSYPRREQVDSTRV